MAGGAGSAGGGLAAAEASGAVVLTPRPGSLLEGSLWHPDPSTLTGPDARRVLADIGRVRSFLAALEALAVERMRLACKEEARRAAQRFDSGGGAGPARFGGDLSHALAVSEVAVAEGISEHAAARLLGAAEALCGAQIAVLEHLESGTLSEAHARVLTDEASTLPPESAEEFGIEALARLETRTGRRRTPGEFRRALRSLRERLHPDSIRARRAKAAQDRGVWVRPEPDGMCTLSALLPAEAGLAAAKRLDTLARAQRRTDPEEARTLPQLRADALANLILTPAAPTTAGAAGTAPPAQAAPAAAIVPEAPEPSAEIVVHIPAATLLGAGEEPATLEGYGPIDAGTARALAAAAPTWQRLFTSTDGVPLALGRTAYRPPKGLRRYIEYRDGTCQFPGCNRPARTAELDHLIEWQDGGPTDAHNLHALCTKHHALKSLRLWNPARLPAGSDDAIADTLWISPLGTRTTTGPTGHHQLEPPTLDPQPLEPPTVEPPTVEPPAVEPPAVELPPPLRGAPPEIRVGGSHAASPQCTSRVSSRPPDLGQRISSPPDPGPRDTPGDPSGDTPPDIRSPESDPTVRGSEAGQMPSEIEPPPF